jgi:hypothetical protein
MLDSYYKSKTASAAMIGETLKYVFAKENSSILSI